MLLKKPNMLNTYQARRSILVFLWNEFNPKKLSLKKNGLLVVPGPDVFARTVGDPASDWSGLTGHVPVKSQAAIPNLGGTV